jgi:FkbM family methyltransferase
VTVCGGELKGSRLWVDLSSEKYYWLGTHEERVQEFVAEHVKPGFVVYDIGAHIGFFTLLFSSLAGTAGRVYAFEPLPQNFDRLTANIEANGLSNVEACSLAISDEEGSATLVVDDSSLKGHLAEMKPGGAENVVRVEARTIDAMVCHAARIPDLLKIDVEGAEGRVMRGAAQTIQACRPRLIIEIHSVQAGREVIDGLPIPYLFQSIATGIETRLPAAAGHYFARPSEGRG